MSKQHSQKRRARITPPPPPAPSTPGHRLTAFQGSSCTPGTAPEPPSPQHQGCHGTSRHFWEDTPDPSGMRAAWGMLGKGRGGSGFRSRVVWLSGSQPFPPGAGKRRVPNLQGLQIGWIPLACYILALPFCVFQR